jgi:vanillate O-demethylase monooxygenase subunit
MTPESEYKTHYFFAGNRNWKTDDLAVTGHIEHAVTQAFATEDKPIIEAQQRQMGETDFWDLKPALLPIDKAGILARRTLSKLIKTEAALAA